MGSIIFSVNAASCNRHQSSVPEFCSRAHDYKELVSNFSGRPSRGFCTNPNCKNGAYKDGHNVRSIHLVRNKEYYFVETNHGVNFCKECEHALFWSSTYKIVDGREHRLHAKARKLSNDTNYAKGNRNEN